MLELVIRIVFSLLVVLGLMWGLARLVRRPLGGSRSGPIAVLGRQQLSKGASVAVVRVVDRAIVVGVTDAQVTLLGEADLAAVTQPDPVERREAVSLDELSSLTRPVASPFAGSALSPRTWSQTLQVLRGRSS